MESPAKYLTYTVDVQEKVNSLPHTQPTLTTYLRMSQLLCSETEAY